MYNILKKYNFVKIVPFEETFFHTATLPKKIKFTKELLKLNYAKYSPLENSNLVSLSNNKDLLLWFFEKDYDEYIVIPESYLAFKSFVKEHTNGIFVIKDDVFKILIIKNSKLVNIFTTNEVDELTLSLTMDEYQLQDKYDIDKQSYKIILEQSKKDLALKDFINFNQLTLDKDTLLKDMVSSLSYPLSFLVVFSMFVSYTQTYLLNADIEKLQDKYIVEKSKNAEIREALNKHNKEIKKYKEFFDKELLYIDGFEVLSKLYGIFKPDEKANLKFISLNGLNLRIQVQTELDSVEILNRLNTISYFKEVVIQSTHKPRNKMKVVTYTITLKSLKEI